MIAQTHRREVIAVSLAVCVPSAAIAVLGISAGAHVQSVDGPAYWVLGFPFIYAKDGSTSLSVVLSLPALLIDYSVYFFLFLGAALAAGMRWSRTTKIVGSCMWILAIGLTLFCWRIATIDPIYVSWIEREAGSIQTEYGARLLGLVFQR